MGCTGLMDVTEQHLASLDVNNATAVCNVRMFVGPTTSAPLAVFDPVTIPTTTTTTQDHFAVVIGGTFYCLKLYRVGQKVSPY